MTTALPPLYAAWLAEALDVAMPGGEPRATCHDCAMCERPSAPPRVVPPFDPVTQCCTYVPILPNFLLGRILTAPDVDAAGLASVRARVASGVAVTPLGVDWPHQAAELYSSTEQNFGRHPDLRCPHHLTAADGTGRCGVWRHRNAICATWFCKHERGETGRLAWKALRDVFAAVEHGLAWHCVDTLGVPPDRRDFLVHRPGLLRGAITVDGHPGGEPTRERLVRLWGEEHVDRREDWYVACWRVVEGFRWADVVEAAGGGVTTAVRELRDRLAGLDATRLPVAVRARPVRVHGGVAGGTLVRAYSIYDPVVLDDDALAGLRALDGRPVADVRREHPALTDDVVRRFLDAQLVDPA
jgi:hypothetical protein